MAQTFHCDRGLSITIYFLWQVKYRSKSCSSISYKTDLILVLSTIMVFTSVT
jgi:hypothetical protein